MMHSVAVMRLLFDWMDMTPEEQGELASGLPPKILRWLGANHPDNRTRKFFFRQSGVRVDSGAVLNPGLLIEDSYADLVHIGARVAIASHVILIASSGPNNSRLAELPEVQERLVKSAPIAIGEDAWLGAGVIVLPGVTIGRGAVIGANAVVTRSVPEYSVAVGTPARVTRQLAR